MRKFDCLQCLLGTELVKQMPTCLVFALITSISADSFVVHKGVLLELLINFKEIIHIILKCMLVLLIMCVCMHCILVE